MKIILKKCLIIVMVLALLIPLYACSDSTGDETFEFSLAHFFPGTHPAEKDFIQVWAKQIDAATDGQVKITSYPGGTLVGAADTYNGVKEGIADIGMSCFAYTRGQFPVLEAFELPGIMYKNSKVASMVAWEGIKQLNPEEVQDTKLLMVIATGPGDLFTTVPIRNLDDLQGVVIRATGLSAKTISYLGGTPEGMPQSEAYEALSKGVVEGNLSPVEVLKGWKHAEVTQYLTRTPFLYNTLFFVTMNLDKWNSMPKKLQDIVMETTEKFHKEIGIGLWDMQNEAGIDFALNEQGMEEIILSDTEAAKWIEKVTPLQDEYAENIKSVTDEDVIGLVKSLAEKYNDIY
ncbi:MAG: TRAP transporter substrate-binding protein [Clostridiales bacterium]|nr:TRAP transporter substrate-binding protein [Clostridiales bacterium]